MLSMCQISSIMATAEGPVAEFSGFANFEEKKRKSNLLMSFPKIVNQMGSFGPKRKKIFLCFNAPTNWQTLLRMRYVLFSVRKGNTNNMMEKKWLCEIFAHSRFIKLWKSNTNTTEKLIKHVLPAKVRDINHLENTNYRTRKRQERGGGGLRKFFCVSTRSRTWHPLYDDQ